MSDRHGPGGPTPRGVGLPGLPTRPDAAQALLGVDPVCGMKVFERPDPITAEHAGTTYFFCCAGCASKFAADPERYLQSPGSEPMRPATVPAPPAGGNVEYVCPMCPEVSSRTPGPCPSCGMALEPAVVTAATRTEYVCPMHPEIVRDGAGVVPDLRHGARAAHRGGRRAAQRRARRHDAPVLGRRRPWPSRCSPSRWPTWSPGGRSSALVAGRWTTWLQLALATPVVLWGGWPFFVRGWRSLVTRHLNMFTLIALGTGAAYVYSLVATLFPASSPTPSGMHGHGGGLLRGGGGDRHPGAARSGARAAGAGAHRRRDPRAARPGPDDGPPARRRRPRARRAARRGPRRRPAPRPSRREGAGRRRRSSRARARSTSRWSPASRCRSRSTPATRSSAARSTARAASSCAPSGSAPTPLLARIVQLVADGPAQPRADPAPRRPRGGVLRPGRRGGRRR